MTKTKTLPPYGVRLDNLERAALEEAAQRADLRPHELARAILVVGIRQVLRTGEVPSVFAVE